MSLTAHQLLKKPSAELDALFAASPPGPIPEAEATGTAIACAGSLFGRVLAWFARWFLWQGKVFDPAGQCLRNRITLFSLTAIKADVYAGKSWFDGLDCIDIPMTRTDIGDYLGMTIETVSRNFSKLRSEGVLRLRSSRSIEILSRKTLYRLAGKN